MRVAGELKLQNLNKTFYGNGHSVHVLSDITLLTEPGEFMTIIGPSGCGKSTLLKIVAGLDTDYEGIAELGGKAIERPGRDKGVIFQEHRLFPWLTVERNIAADLSLKIPEVRSQVDALLTLVRLNGFEKAYPKELSGGMSQRVAIARALLRNPQVLLLDEPFGALDAFTRSHMQESLLDIWRKNRTTMLLVTHDIDEAIFLSNRIVVMGAKPGVIKAVIPVELSHPRNRNGSAFQEYRQLLLQALEKREPSPPAWDI